MWAIAIIVVSMVAAMAVTWRAPGLSLYARDALARARGAMPPPPEVVIVAIDEASIKRFGRFPWPRSVMAQALDRIAAAQPKAIALSVLFSDPTVEADDAALAGAIKRAGNVVVAAQLIETPLRRAEWLRPLPAIEQAAIGMGHGNVLTDFDGVARALTLRETDDEGNALWAMAVQTIRVGDGVSAPEGEEVRDVPDAVKIGSRRIPIEADSPIVTITSRDPNVEVKTIRASRLMIDYLGPAGSFAGASLSIADLIEGRVDAERLRGKYVLIGATAAAMGDRVASPFARYASEDGDQHGALVSGVEVLANALTTMLRSRFYQQTPDWIAALIAALVAAAVIGSLRLAQGRYELLRQLGALIGMIAVILLLSYFAFTRWLILPPLIPALAALTVAAPLALLRRALGASASLDARIVELTRESATLSPLKLRARGEAEKPSSRSAEAKADALAELQKRLLARTRFVDRALRSVEDGLIIADTSGIIAFANPRAARILGVGKEALPGSNLFGQLNWAETGNIFPDDARFEQAARESLARLYNQRESIEREIAINGGQVRYYILRMAAVVDENEAPLGIVATISDITRQRELRQMQTDVMALVTHEMKTPLMAIQGMSEALMKFDPDAAKRRVMSRTINEAAQRMKRMIDEYLDLTRLESGAAQPRFGFVRIQSLIEQNLLLLDPLAAQRKIKLKRALAANLPPLLADADLLSRAVTNLVANAIKYSPPNTEITVSASAGGDTILVAVADQGYGIPAEHRARIFEKFYRVPRAEDADAPGAGLGLAMVREIAELHGGRVTVESEAGAGSTFTLRLPLKPSVDEPKEE